MNLLIMRHGEAEPYASEYKDESRPLTDHGRKQVRAKSQAIAAYDPKMLLASPFLRTQQTADIIEASLERHAERTACDWIRSESSVESAIFELNQLQAEALLLVSHMPFVSMLVEYLTGARIGFRPADVALVTMDYVGREQGEFQWVE